jgi:translation initiation factor 6 (eIF-6)
MNEQIEHCLYQAGLTAQGCWDKLDDYAKEGIEKFAQLIVQECIGKCEFVADMATVTNSGEMARKTKATADSCAAMIKEHFGVEQ